MQDETAKDNRHTAALISHDLMRNKELAFSAMRNLQFYLFQILKYFFLDFGFGRIDMNEAFQGGFWRRFVVVNPPVAGSVRDMTLHDNRKQETDCVTTVEWFIAAFKLRYAIISGIYLSACRVSRGLLGGIE